MSERLSCNFLKRTDCSVLSMASNSRYCEL
nr:MAG TPA: hypothetical protein [Caudoviricetes sp.]